jgi:hypothetical protein
MADQRTPTEKRLDELLGPPLYYCADCLRAVKVTAVIDAEPLVVRPCGPECGEQIMAPRKAIVVGEGGMNFATKAKLSVMQLLAAATGRCV